MSENELEEGKTHLNFEEIFFRFRYPILFLFLGFIFVGVGMYLFKNTDSKTKVEVLSETSENSGEIIVEVAGAVPKPGVYTFKEGARVEEALWEAGGLSEDADYTWVEKTLNRASKLTDGQKIYIPKSSEQSNSLSAKNSGEYQTASLKNIVSGESLVNINTSDQKTLESLPKIGQAYAQKIIEQRPYSTIEELRTKDVIPVNAYEEIKNLITAY
jgi:competence protein ComEA